MQQKVGTTGDLCDDFFKLNEKCQIPYCNNHKGVRITKNEVIDITDGCEPTSETCCKRMLRICSKCYDKFRWCSNCYATGLREYQFHAAGILYAQLEDAPNRKMIPLGEFSSDTWSLILAQIALYPPLLKILAQFPEMKDIFTNLTFLEAFMLRDCWGDIWYDEDFKLKLLQSCHLLEYSFDWGLLKQYSKQQKYCNILEWSLSKSV